MPVCPVCEHLQPGGEECEVCGKRLGGPGASAGQVEPLPGLEPTLAPRAEAVAERLDGLEPTRLEPAGDPHGPADREWMEQTATAAAPDAPADTVPDLERHLAEPIPDDGPDPLAPATCRYCRTPVLPNERICGRCGMRVPLFDAAAVAEAQLEARCPECGAAAPGARCRRCGARLPGARTG